jgi:hypothetical protein
MEQVLASKQCVPCKGGVSPLKGEALQELVRQLDGGWQVANEHHLEREHTFKPKGLRRTRRSEVSRAADRWSNLSRKAGWNKGVRRVVARLGGGNK